LQCKFLEAPWCFWLCSCNFWHASFCDILQVLAWTLLTRTVEFLSDLRLSKGHLWILTLFGLTRGAAAPSFVY
jgi:hypothetical protein